MIAATACALTISRRASAQDEGPIIVGVEREWDTIKFNPTNFVLDFVARYENDEEQTPGEPKTRDTELLLTQALTASTSGYVGHPNFIEFNLSGTFGLSESWVHSDTFDLQEDSIESLIEYNVSALFFRQSDTPLTLYSTRTQTFINRQFADSLDSVVMQHGARMVMRSPSTPMAFHYFHREEEQTSDL